MAATKRYGALHDFRRGALSSFVAGEPLCEVGAAGGGTIAADESQAAVFAGYRLQDIDDYRAALQTWFRAVRVGGHLVVVVPHAFLHERQLALPSRWNPDQRRLYTPHALLAEIEEALPPGSYRVCWLADDDAGYDYTLDREIEPVGARDILLAIKRIAPIEPRSLALPVEPTTTDPVPELDRPPFGPVASKPRRKLLILKLDHLGDFIMATPALEKARAVFADWEITLVVGSWNRAAAAELGVANHVLAFDVFPRNSSEGQVDVVGKTALFQRLLTDEYDLAIDLRSDLDTRFLLRSVRADVRAGIGTRSQFPFLDIFLPIDFSRNEPETAREQIIDHHAFASAHYTVREDYRISCRKDKARWESAMIWGPYRALRPGRYIFEPYIELEDPGDGILSLDIALDTKWVTFLRVPTSEPIRLSFVVEKPGTEFEFRIWSVEDAPPISFSFFGGRLIREGAASVLHQAEYLFLLIELVVMRIAQADASVRGEATA